MQDTIENYIRIGHTATGEYGNYVCEDLQPFPTPSGITYSLNDVDKDPFTDLAGFTHRNRVRIDVLSVDLEYKYLEAETKKYLLQRIKPEWFYVEIINPDTNEKEIHKMYASSKKSNVLKVTQDGDGNYINEYIDFQVSFVEE